MFARCFMGTLVDGFYFSVYTPLKIVYIWTFNPSWMWKVVYIVLFGAVLKNCNPCQVGMLLWTTFFLFFGFILQSLISSWSNTWMVLFLEAHKSTSVASKVLKRFKGIKRCHCNREIMVDMHSRHSEFVKGFNCNFCTYLTCNVLHFL